MSSSPQTKRPGNTSDFTAVKTGRWSGGDADPPRSHPAEGLRALAPTRKTLVLLEQVEEVLEEYEDFLPLTVRQIFYRLVGVYGYDKTENAYDNLAEKLNRARRAKMIEFSAIRDDGVSVLRSQFYGGVEDFQDETMRRARSYRRDRQQDQKSYLELWCEAAGMMTQLRRVADEYSVPVYSARRFSSLTANRNVAERAIKRNRPTVMLTVEDYNPSGESIFDAMSRDARSFVRAGPRDPDERPHRRTCRADREPGGCVQPFRPPHRSPATAGPAAGREARPASWKPLPPDDLAVLVRDAIEHYMDLDLCRVLLAQEASDRATLLGLPRGSNNGSDEDDDEDDEEA